MESGGNVEEEGTVSFSARGEVLDFVIRAGDMWFPFKELNDVMSEVIRDSEPSEKLIKDVDRVLTRHAADFSSLFMVKPPSPVDRAELWKCATEGSNLNGMPEKQVTHSLVNEAILISDLFQINEFLALDILTIAENERYNYPNWPRGLVAVYMFYQSRVWLICTLCTLIRCSPGRQWISHFHSQILVSFQRILNVVSDDLINRLVNLMEVYSTQKQLELLESKLALGDSHHRHRVTSLLHQINETLAQTIFCYACQMGLHSEELILILDYLKVQVNPLETVVSKGSATLIATVIYTLEIKLTSPNIDMMTFGECFRKYLKDHKDGGFKSMELYDLFKLSFLIAAHKLPSGSVEIQQPSLEEGQFNGERHVYLEPYGELSEIPNKSVTLSEESRIVAGGKLCEQPMFVLLGDESGDLEFTRNVFKFLQTQIFARPSIYTWDSDICKIFHGFFVDFIIHMPLKLKEIKYRSEEAAKTKLLCQEQNIPDPSLPAVPEFESFLECLGEFYKHEPFELGRYYFLDEAQYLPLSKLVRMCCMESALLFASCMRFLTGVSTGNPYSMFKLLRESNHNASLEHFFESVTRYVQNFMAQPQPISVSMIINPKEIESICSYLQLLQLLCTHNESVRAFFTTQKPSWFCSALQVVKICKFPREIRIAMLDTCTAMIGENVMNPDVASTIWNIFYSINLIEPGSRDLQMELNDEAVKLQDYSLTIAMLNLVQALIKSRFLTMDYVSLESYAVPITRDSDAILQYITFVINAVFLRMPYLIFKDINQRWSMMKLCADIFSIMLDYLPRLMIELLRDSSLVRILLNSIVECTLTAGQTDDSSGENKTLLSNEVASCSLSLLMLLWRALQRQQYYLIYKRQLVSKQEVDQMLLVGIHEIIMTSASNQRGTVPIYLGSIIRFVDFMFSSHLHMQTALDILSGLLEDHTDIDDLIYRQLLQQKEVANVFRQTIVDLLYRVPSSTDVTTEFEIQNLIMSALKLIRSSMIHVSPNVGTFLIGFDVKENKFIGLRKQTVVHALMDNAAIIPTSFMTLMGLLTDSRMSHATFELLRYFRFFQTYLRQAGIISELSFEGLAYFLKSLAVALKLEEGLGQLALELAGASFTRMEEILNIIHMDNPVEKPNLQFFHVALVLETIEQCEYVDEELKVKLVRVEKLDKILKSDIRRLSRNTGVGFRKSVYSEAKDIMEFAKKLNQSRCREGCKLMVFDGWRQVVEILVLNPLLHRNLPVFCSSVLRMLLGKMVVGDKEKHPSEYILRIAAETTLTLCAVMSTGAGEREYASGTALSVVIYNLCSWIQSSQNVNVRGILYASLLYCVNLLGTEAERQGFGLDTLLSSQNAFPMILQNLCRDCCVGVGQRTRMQALFLLGEIIKCTTQRGFGGSGGVLEEGIYEGSAQQSGERNAEDPKKKFCHNGAIRDLNSHLPSATFISTSRDDKNKTMKDNCVRGIDRAVMNCVYTNGFLSTLVDALCVADDIDLMTLFTSTFGATQEEDPIDNRDVIAMRAFFVFEAKLTMFSRLAGAGYQAVMHLMDLKLIENLTSMKLFELQTHHHDQHLSQIEMISEAKGCFGGSRYPLVSPMFEGNAKQAGGNQKWLKGIGLPVAASTPTEFQKHCSQETPSQQVDNITGMPILTIMKNSGSDKIFNPSYHTISESLYTQVLKLFHVMIDSAPQNLLVIMQILEFLQIHDITVSKLLSSIKVGGRNCCRHAVQLLTSLLCKLAKNQQRIKSMTPIFPSNAKASLKPRLFNILRMEAEGNIAQGDEMITALVKQVLLFLYYCSKKADVEDSDGDDMVSREQNSLPPINPVLTNRFDLDTVLKDEDANVSLGVVISCVVNAAQNIVQSQIVKTMKFYFGGVTTGEEAAATAPRNQSTGSPPPLVSYQQLTSPQTFLTDRMMKDSEDIIELGLTLIYTHLQLFIQEYQEEKRLKMGDRLVSYVRMVSQHVENNLTRVVTEACKKIHHEDYIETLLYNIRKSVLPTTVVGSL